MRRYPQTNIQLYGELREAGFGEAALAHARKAYDCAMELFSGRFRGSGKPFLSHLVGTAGILARIGARADVVAAGLLHAAYTDGEFGNGLPGVSPKKRARIRRAVGRATEELVARYTSFHWTRETIPRISETVESFSADERDVLRIRLANELEDHLDLGVLYCRNADERKRYLRRYLVLCTSMAEKLGDGELAAALGETFEETLAARVEKCLLSRQRFSFLVIPASCRPRPRVRIYYPLTRRLAPFQRKWSALKARIRSLYRHDDRRKILEDPS